MTQPTDVLVHGAFADASWYAPVTSRLLKRGFKVVAPGVPNRSLLGDAAYMASLVRGASVNPRAASPTRSWTPLVFTPSPLADYDEKNPDVTVDVEKFPEVVATDVDPDLAAVLPSSQRPLRDWRSPRRQPPQRGGPSPRGRSSPAPTPPSIPM
ncbi:hypothetical protein ACFZDK_51660 [Streptomyces sp. NPDC007901]|uniref:hypothetical protein n=1 Tax=Streptomyces sp. NPDC007901 TaxID=3364785 RepID=UPI0036F0DC38